MANKSVQSDTGILVDGSFDWSGGVDSSKVTTLQSELIPNGIRRDQVMWMNNATVRTAGILQRTGWQPLLKVLDSGRWQGGFMYEPDGGNPYLICSISGTIYQVILEVPYSLTNLSAPFGLFNPTDAEIAFFCQGENHLVIQAGDFYTPGTPVLGTTDALGRTLPLFWNGTTLRRSIGITTAAPLIQPGQNEIPAATCMDYYGNRIWYAQGRAIFGSDMLGALSGTPAERYRDSILNITENPLCFAGDGFTVPTNAGNIRAIKHSANLNAALGQGQLYIFTRKVVYQLTVPTTRTDWINADTNNQPRLDVVQLINGAVGDRCVVPVNGDLFYQSFEPAIRSLIRAQTQFGQGQWGNTPISQNEERALQFNDRALMRFSSGIEFNNRILMAALPKLAADGINVIHQGILPLDFDIVTNLTEKKSPVWEGIWDGLQILELHTGDFGGRQRSFASSISDEDGSIKVWELTVDDRMQNGDNRVTWGIEFPAYTWATSGYEYRLKQLNGGELWIDKLASTVDFDVYYRADAEPCWRHWFHNQICTARCEDLDSALTAYPCEPCREGYVFTVAFPEPLAVCNQMQVRPTTIGYQFQIKIVLKGWCRIRGLLLYALPKSKPQFQGIACPPNLACNGMATLPEPFLTGSTGTVSRPCSISTDSTLAGATVGVAYSAKITAIGGAGSLALEITSGTLPSGLSMSSSGLISGTPTEATSSAFVVTATDSAGVKCYKTFSILSTYSECLVADLVQTTGTVGNDYSEQLSATGGVGTITFDVTSGTLPGGLTLTSGGLLSGELTTSETATFTVTATDSIGTTCSKEFTIEVTGPIFLNSPPDGTECVLYNNPPGSFTFLTDPTPCTFSGTVPDGLSMTAAGVVSGYPSTSGPQSFNVTAQDVHGNINTFSSIVNIADDGSGLARSANDIVYVEDMGSRLDTWGDSTMVVVQGNGQIEITITIKAGGINGAFHSRWETTLCRCGLEPLYTANCSAVCDFTRGGGATTRNAISVVFINVVVHAGVLTTTGWSANLDRDPPIVDIPPNTYTYIQIVGTPDPAIDTVCKLTISITPPFPP